MTAAFQSGAFQADAFQLDLVLFWVPVPTPQTPDWSPVHTIHAATWVDINTAQTPDWELIVT